MDTLFHLFIKTHSGHTFSQNVLSAFLQLILSDSLAKKDNTKEPKLKNYFNDHLFVNKINRYITIHYENEFFLTQHRLKMGETQLPGYKLAYAWLI